ncbi:ATPase domain-containing protein [Chthonobacter rhizosphaerae]|uniref:ATPase domain-containing protein n=1 Tax=Chthonobacter rhizosphaerae TaxID=2735553 RepID=UPI001FE78D84|nr:ATPase domain-containing protein [Chthonobacter rhizosphaerae]
MASTGVAGLDNVLNGGLTRGHLFLVEGEPGAGKTTIALQFVLAGSRAGEKTLYITLSESEREIREGAASHGWTIGDDVVIFELVPPESLASEENQQSLLYTSDLELGETAKDIIAAMDRVRPARVVIDSLSEIRLLAQSSLRYRRQILALKHHFARFGATVLMLDDLTSDGHDRTMHSLTHGVIKLEQLAPEFGAERRRLRVLKYRGKQYRGGYHDFAIGRGGVRVYPRLVAGEHYAEFRRSRLQSGIPELDDILGGGVDQGSGTLVLGPAGTGKTLFGLHFAKAALARGEAAAIFIFDEERALLTRRMGEMGIDLSELREGGRLHVQQVDAAEMSPGEFSHLVRRAVETLGATCVVIDSLNGYQAAMPDERLLILHMHELLQFLNRRGASTFLTVAQHGLVGDMRTPIDITYLADTVVLLRYFEAGGEVRRALSVVKKRLGSHENTIREYRIGSSGLRIGRTVKGFHGVLRGVPSFDGDRSGLLKDDAT